MSRYSSWNDRFAIEKSEVGTDAAKAIKKKKIYISMNGSEVKATIDTGPSKLRKKVKVKPKTSSPIQNKTLRKTARRKLSNPIVASEEVMSPTVIQERPYTLPTIDQQPLVSLSVAIPDNTLRSSTGAPCGRPRMLPLTQSENSLEIDVSLENAAVTAKEKRQWREFSTLTEDRAQDSSNCDLVRLMRIGKGSSAYVYKSVLFPSLRVVADKVVVISNKEKSSQLVRELRSLRAAVMGPDTAGAAGHAVGSSSATCANIVRLLEVYPNPRDGTISVCLEYMDGGSLQDVVRAGGCQNELVLTGIARQILSGVAFLHAKRHLHRDIKPGNILINSRRVSPVCGSANGTSAAAVAMQSVKLSDFGLSKELETGNSLADSFLGTFHYMSPERISGGDYSFPSDIWGVGMTVLALAMGRYPFLAGSPRATGTMEMGEGGYWAILQAIQERPSVGPLLASTRRHCEGHRHSYAAIHPPTKSKEHMFSQELHSFLSMALHRDHKQRPSAHTLLSYPFVTCTAQEYSQVTVATEEFIEQCYVRNAAAEEARAESAIERCAQFSAKGDGPHLGSVVAEQEAREVLSAIRTADKNAYPRRKNRLSIHKDSNPTVTASSAQPSESSGMQGSVNGLGQGDVGDSSAQKEGVKHLKQIVRAYQEYINRTWSSAMQTGGSDKSGDNTMHAETERAILNTLWPLLDVATMHALALHLHVPLRIVKKAFKKIVMDIRAKVEVEALRQGTASSAAHGIGFNSSSVDQELPEVGADERVSVAAAAGEIRLAHEEVPMSTLGRKKCKEGGRGGRGGRGVVGSAEGSLYERVMPTVVQDDCTEWKAGDAPRFPIRHVTMTETDNIVGSDCGGSKNGNGSASGKLVMDPLELSGSAEIDAYAVEELRSLVRCSSQQHTSLDTYRSGGMLTQRSGALALETAREIFDEAEEEEEPDGSGGGGYLEKDKDQDDDFECASDEDAHLAVVEPSEMGAGEQRSDHRGRFGASRDVVGINVERYSRGDIVSDSACLSEEESEEGEEGGGGGIHAVDSMESIVDEVAEAMAAMTRGEDYAGEVADDEALYIAGRVGADYEEPFDVLGDCVEPDIVLNSEPPSVDIDINSAVGRFSPAAANRSICESMGQPPSTSPHSISFSEHKGNSWVESGENTCIVGGSSCTHDDDDDDEEEEEEEDYEDDYEDDYDEDDS